MDKRIQRVKGCVVETAKQIHKSTGQWVIIPHIVNNKGYWGSGVVIPIGNEWPQAKQRYLSDWKKEKLGYNQYINIIQNGNICYTVVNMFAQDGISSKSTGDRKDVVSKPLKYAHLIRCMEAVSDLGDHIVCPKFGSLRAGGNWDFIEELIEELWCPHKEVTVCEYE